MGRLGAGFVSSDVSRAIVTGSQTENISIDHDDYVYSGYGETGYKFKLVQNFNLTPFVGMSYDSVKRGSFRENRSLLGLKVNSKTYNQTSGSIGLRGEYDFAWIGGKSTILGYASWQKAFNDKDLSFEASYVGMLSEKFTVKGIRLSRESAWAGMGISTEINENWVWYANYDMQISDSDILNNVFSVGVRLILSK